MKVPMTIRWDVGTAVANDPMNNRQIVKTAILGNFPGKYIQNFICLGRNFSIESRNYHHDRVITVYGWASLFPFSEMSPTLLLNHTPFRGNDAEEVVQSNVDSKNHY